MLTITSRESLEAAIAECVRLKLTHAGTLARIKRQCTGDYKIDVITQASKADST